MAKSAIPVDPKIAARAGAVQAAGVPAMPAKGKKKKHRGGPMPAQFKGKTTGRDTSDNDADDRKGYRGPKPAPDNDADD